MSTPETRATRIGYLPTAHPRPVPIKVTAVLIELSTGELMRYPVVPARALTAPPRHVDFISGRAHLGRD